MGGKNPPTPYTMSHRFARVSTWANGENRIRPRSTGRVRLSATSTESKAPAFLYGYAKSHLAVPPPNAQGHKTWNTF